MSTLLASLKGAASKGAASDGVDAEAMALEEAAGEYLAAIEAKDAKRMLAARKLLRDLED